MTVRRTGISGEERPTKKSLGRILVTIDDLEALRQQLQGDDDDGQTVNFEFAGGEFSSTDELKQLSDDELRHIDVKAPDVQVVLCFTHAEAIGPPNSVQSVYEQWARARQTKRKPPGWSRIVTGDCVVAALFIAILIGAYYFRIGGLQLTTFSDYVAAGLISVLVVAPPMIRAWRFRKSYAIIMPMSREQLRRQEFEVTRARKATLATIAGALIAAFVAIIIALVAKK